MSDAEQDTKLGRRGAVHRSPSYPAINLKAAVDRAQTFYMYEKRAEASVSVAAQHWGYKVSSSGGRQVLAALISYGLMEDRGSNEQRYVRLTDLAFQILLDERPDSVERVDALRRAALLPKIHAELFAHWPDGLPSTPNLRHYLLVAKKFNDNAVDDFIKELRITAEFAKIYKQNVADVSSSVSNGGSLSPSDTDEQDTSGESSPMTAGTGTPSPALRSGGLRLPEANSQVRQDTFTLDEGQVILQWPTNLSEHSYEDLKDWLELQMRKIRRGIHVSARD
jgi:hypothetical protein